ncbi:hypothetical protein F4678DRAFT_463329 [Xylaria arbuscula]|nr:hypothetical protein F4678DRAFT_463329 [Xylaria arbuscula]
MAGVYFPDQDFDYRAEIDINFEDNNALVGQWEDVDNAGRYTPPDNRLQPQTSKAKVCKLKAQNKLRINEKSLAKDSSPENFWPHVIMTTPSGMDGPHNDRRMHLIPVPSGVTPEDSLKRTNSYQQLPTPSRRASIGTISDTNLNIALPHSGGLEPMFISVKEGRDLITRHQESLLQSQLQAQLLLNDLREIRRPLSILTNSRKLEPSSLETNPKVIRLSAVALERTRHNVEFRFDAQPYYRLNTHERPNDSLQRICQERES